MKEIFSKYKYSLALLVIILLGYWTFSSYYPQFGQYLESPEDPIGEELFEELNRLRGTTLNSDIFNDQDFTILQDFETQVPPARAGRSDPFAPIGNDGAGVLVEPTYQVAPISTTESFLDQSTTTPQE